MIEIAKKYFDAGISVAPMGKDKLPRIGDVTDNKLYAWKKHQTQLINPNGLFNKCFGMALVCGYSNIEAIDIDLKYDLTGKLFDEYKKLINECDGNLLKKLVVQKTMNGGYHFIYKCNTIEGNQKISNRYTTDAERKINPDEKNKVLIETRGVGGYIALFPTPGYQIAFGDIFSINEITPDERQILFNCAKSFNEVWESPYIPKEAKKIYTENLSPFEDWNNRGDIMQLLINNGWKPARTKGSKNFLLRPGGKGEWSADYDTERRLLYVWTSSTSFTNEKAYNPTHVLTTIQFNGDYSAASKWLRENGYGDSQSSNAGKQAKKENKQSIVANSTGIYRADDALWEKMKHTFQTGKERGTTTHFTKFDTNFTWKRGEVTLMLGTAGFGKSEFILQLMLLKSKFDNWKWGVYSPENYPEDEFYDALIHAYIGKTTDPFYKQYQMSLPEYQQGYEFIKTHFFYVFPEESQTMSDVEARYLSLIETEKINGTFTDPFNSLDVDDGMRDDKLIKEFALNRVRFAKKHMTCDIISVHPAKQSRLKNGQFPKITIHDIAGGAMWANKMDNILAIDRPEFYQDRSSTKVEIDVLRIKKQKLVGIPGMCQFDYSRKQNRYFIDGISPLGSHLSQSEGMASEQSKYSENNIGGNFKKYTKSDEVEIGEDGFPVFPPF